MAPEPKFPNSKILIVDDNPVSVRLLRQMLLETGYLNVATTTQPAGVCAYHQESCFDLILLDIMMPGFDGFRVMQSLKSVTTDSYPSILVMTAQPDHMLRAMQAGAKDFISKPFDHSEFLSRIEQLLESRLAQREIEKQSALLKETIETQTAGLRKHASMFRALVANIPDALWIKNVDQKTIEYVNPAWAELHGHNAAPGDSVISGQQTIHPDDLQWFNNERRSTSHGAASTEYRLLRPDQSIRWVQSRSFHIPNPAGPSPLIVEIIEDITQRKETQHQLVHMARHDALTGLPNRTLLYESLGKALQHASHDGVAASILLIDVDHFKSVNDTLGHAIGDALLCEFAQRLMGCIRPTDTVGRLGGDEFAVVVLTPRSLHGPMEVAYRIIEALQKPFLVQGKSIPVTASIGIASCPPEGANIDALLRCADIAMYEAKQAGRNTLRRYTPQMNARLTEKLDIEDALRFAQSRNEFVLNFQPKMHIRSGKWTGVEALIRWNRPGHGLVLPQLFIPALEDLGLIVPVGAWVLDTACRQIRDWRDRGLEQVPIAVNVSARQVCEEGFAARIAGMLKEHDVDPALLELEITEGTLMGHNEATDTSLRQLRDIGLSISIDDFGTGYSNLSYLKRFPVNALKIDIAFIRDVTTNPDDATITTAMIKMAHSLRLKVVAEGVETSEQLDFLRMNGCDEAQGYYISRPLSADALFERFADLDMLESAPRLTAEAG
jgi:diguanylate cyclase (GGDEF)-like protein/PAS domain S-box-containing protein